nr:unnamed protein product [Callosobruchus analis]
MCIELNAHNLIKLILSFRNRGNELKPEMMCLSVFSSQSCEKLFRSARSLTSTFSTAINFSIKGLLQRIDRIKTINDTLCDLSDIFVFPREANKREREFHTPTLDELLNLDIEQVIMNCFTEYYQDSEENSEEEIDKGTIYNEDDSKFELNVIIENQNQENDNKKINMLGLKNYSDTVQDITEDSQYVKIVIDNKVASHKKSSYIWLLDEHEGKISNDRMRRFIAKEVKGEQKKGRTRERPKQNRKTPEENMEQDELRDEMGDSSSESSLSDFSVRDTSEKMETFLDIGQFSIQEHSI